MTLSVHVFSDYVCPYCFLAEGPLAAAIEEIDRPVTVEWMPFELRAHPTPTLEPEGDYLQNAWRESVYPLAARMGVEIVLPKVSPQPYTRLAFEGALFARENDKGNAYNHKMFTAFFQEERDIGDPSVLSDCAAEIGLDREAFDRDLDAGRYRELCGTLLEHGRKTLAINSVPTFVIGRYMLPGLADRKVLLEAMRLALSEAEAAPEPKPSAG